MFYGLLKTGQRIATPDISGRILMDRLKSQLHPHWFDPVQGVKKLQHIISQTVRPGSDGQCHDIRMGDGFCEDSAQMFHRSVGVGIGLKIGNVLMDWALGREACDLCVDLFCDGKRSACRKISASSLTAENAAVFAKGAVTVGTGHAAI